jgi:predicted PurR-regulated permease PerM
MPTEQGQVGLPEAFSGKRTGLIPYLLILGFFGFLAAKMILPYLMSLIMGGILALLSLPLFKRTMGKKLGKKTAALLVTAFVIVLVVGPILVFASLAIKQGVSFGNKLADHEHLSLQFVIDHIATFPPVRMIFDDPKEVETQIREVFGAAGSVASSLVITMAKSIPDMVLQLALASMACFFFLVDGPHFIRWVNARLPLDREIRSKLAATFKDTAISVVWASMAAAAAQALLMTLAFASLGVSAAFLAGGATFIFAWIPILGSAPIWLTGAVLLYSQGELGKMIAMLILGGVTSLLDNVIRPYILKGRGEMHPLVSLVAIFGGIQMFGLFGVLLGPILVAVMISLLQVWPVIGQRFGYEFESESPSSVVETKQQNG